MLFTVYDINIIMEAWCALFSLVGLFCVGFFAQSAQRSARWYRRNVSLMFMFNMFTALADGVACFCRGKMTTFDWYGTHVGNAITFCTLFMLAGAFTSYFCARLEERDELNWWGSLTWALCGVGIALTLAGLFYTIDPETNIYQRSEFFWISQVIGIIIMVGNLCILLAKSRRLNAQTLFSMFVYITMPLVSFFVQTYVEELSINQMATTAALMVLFVDLQSYLAQNMNRQQRELSRKERELMDSRVQIMVSQIQPHFLYNTLDSIYYLCGKDPMRARSAISMFSDYLRMNLRSLRSQDPVPFSTELQHAQNYLELEQMSSDDTISVLFDIQTTNFKVPPLSLQPLVENAVKHGITKRAEGGTIIVRTRELPSYYEISVEDDGVGFDVNAEPDTSRPHVGMQNVRQRIESQCHGTMSVTSEPGKGTTVVIRVPREKESSS